MRFFEEISAKYCENKKFYCSLPYSLYVFRDIGRPTDDFLNAMQIFCILLASMAQSYMKVPVKD